MADAVIEYLGHAGLAVEYGGKKLLCDPWMSPAGAYNASWFQYPEYPHKELGHLLTPDAVYVSHEHPDHYDPWFLAQLPKDTPMITGRFHKRLIVRKLHDLGFENVYEFDDFESWELAPDFVVEVEVPKQNCAPHWFDSCAYITAGDLRILNLNDANSALDFDKMRERGMDVLLGQASPAIWYPLTYTCYDEEQKRPLRAARRLSAVESFAKDAQALAPRLAIPFAGPPCFFDEDLAQHFVNEDSMFPTHPTAAEHLEAAGIPAEVLKPGDRLRLSTQGYEIEREPAYADFDYERDRRSYYEAHKAEKQALVREVLAAIPDAEPGLYDRFRRHMVPLLRRNPFFLARINMRVLFNVTGPNGGSWVVDFRDDNKGELVYPHEGEQCTYHFEFEARNVEQVLRGEFSWEDLLLSLRFKASRDPDRYNQHLFTFLKMANQAALQAIAAGESRLEDTPTTTFELEHEGARYEVQRFCPHAGSDLSEADIVDGQIVCPGHRWHFELGTGECSESDYRIHCRRLGRAPGAAGDKAA